MEIMTTSRLRDARACKRLHYYRHIVCRRPIRLAAPLSFGRIFHDGLEQWWLGWKEIQAGNDASRVVTKTDEWGAERVVGGSDVNLTPDLVRDVALEAVKTSFYGVAEDAELNPYDLVRATELMRGYDARWRGEMSVDGGPGIVVVAVEAEFFGPLINPETNRPSRTYSLGGKIDVVVNIDGEMFNMEHKSTSSPIDPGSTYWTRLRMDPQVSTYHRGAEILGYDVMGSIYDVAKKPTLRPYRATPMDKRKYKADGSLYANMRAEDETPSQYGERVRQSIIADPNAYYQRGEVTRLDEDIIEHMKDTWLSARNIRDSELANSHPRNPDACERWNRFCDYYGVCTGTASLDDDTMFRDSAQHEELSKDQTE